VTAVRTLLTVLVGAALLGASLPAVEDARDARTAARLDATAGRLVDAAAALAAVDDPVPAGERAAGRTVVITLPRAGIADARADYLTIGGTPETTAPSTVAYRVDGRPPRRLDASVTFLTGSDPLVLRPGRHRLRLTLVSTPETVGVRVRPLSTRSVDPTSRSRSTRTAGGKTAPAPADGGTTTVRRRRPAAGTATAATSGRTFK
jgi:hypothetical protein